MKSAGRTPDIARKLRDLFPDRIGVAVVQRLGNDLSRWFQVTQFAQERQARRYDDPRCLTRYGYRNFSQFDEDGIIDEIFRRIGLSNRSFVEFGVEAGLENNTMALLLQGWNGLWIEADATSCEKIREEFREPLARGQLRLLERFVTAESIEDLLLQGAVPAEPDLLGIDIDGNDYWVWKAIQRVRARVVVIEYNASLGRSARAVRPYDPAARWDLSTATGASLGALEDLGRSKGYSLVGCGIAGVNAFFVRSDLVEDQFLAPFTAATHYEPPRYGRYGGGHTPRWGEFIQP